MQVVIFWRSQRGPAPYTRRSAMHRSKLDIGGEDAGAGGMSVSSGSSGASGMGASSSSSDASAMAHSTGSAVGEGTRSAGVGDLLVCERSGASWSPPAQQL